MNLFGICLVCGFEISQSNKEPARTPEDMTFNREEEFGQNLQDIIDAAVSHQAASILPTQESGEFYSMPAAEDTDFLEIDMDEDESPTDGFYVINAPDVSAAEQEPAFLEIGMDEDESPTDGFYVINAPDVSAAEQGPAFLEIDMDEDESAMDGLYAVAKNDASDISYATDAKGDAETEDIAETQSDVKTGDESDAADAKLARTLNFLGADSTGAENAPDFEGRLIFLSRTLSGLIDLFLIALFSGIFLGIADYFTNAPILNSMNAINFATTFLMIYFLYSIFFLGTNSQTIGMMSADLHVVGVNKKHFSMSQVVRRSVMFPVSLFGFGIGLLIGLFSRKCLCLHDRFSGTRVVRVNPDIS